MSASLYIIDLERHGLAAPATLRDFGAILETLGGREDAPNPRFAELGKRLEEKYPPPEKADGESVWLSSPAAEAASLGTALWNLELPREDAIAVERFIVAAATQLGLVAYDDQVGIGFLPGGIVVPAERRALWEQSLAAIDSGEVLASESAVRDVVVPAIDAVLRPQGFAAKRKDKFGYSRFVRKVGAVRQELSLRVIRGTSCELQFTAYHDALSELWYRLHPKAVSDIAAFLLGLEFFHPGPERFGGWKVERREDVRPVVAMLQGKLLPLADLASDLGGLDQLANDDSVLAIRTVQGRARGEQRAPGSDGSLGLRQGPFRPTTHYVLAKLNGNPCADQIAAELEALYAAKSRDDLLTELRELREALEGVPPLARWRDAAEYRDALRPIPEALLRRTADARCGRVHHCEVADLLRTAAGQDPVAFRERFGGDAGPGELQALWQARAETLPAEHRMAPDGLRRSVRTLPGAAGRAPIELLAIDFPPVTGVGETATLALATSGERSLAFTLGHSWRLERGQMLFEVVYEDKGVRATREYRRRPTEPEFLDYIRETFAREPR